MEAKMLARIFRAAAGAITRTRFCRAATDNANLLIVLGKVTIAAGLGLRAVITEPTADLATLDRRKPSPERIKIAIKNTRICAATYVGFLIFSLFFAEAAISFNAGVMFSVAFAAMTVVASQLWRREVDGFVTLPLMTWYRNFSVADDVAAALDGKGV
jgi:hypothetical protein